MSPFLIVHDKTDAIRHLQSRKALISSTMSNLSSQNHCYGAEQIDLKDRLSQSSFHVLQVDNDRGTSANLRSRSSSHATCDIYEAMCTCFLFKFPSAPLLTKRREALLYSQLGMCGSS